MTLADPSMVRAEVNGQPDTPHVTVDALLRRRATLHPAHPERHLLRRQAIEASVPAAASLARRYAHRGEPLADLRQVAYIGLLKAVDGFDSSYDTEFWSYATPTITGEIKRHFRDCTWAVHVPRRYKDMEHTIKRCREELIRRLRRPPRVADLAEHLGEDTLEITRALTAKNGHSPYSLSTRCRAGGASPVDPTAFDEPGYELVELRESLRPALAELPHRERRIVVMRFYANMTQAQIAAEVGVSQVHVSRLLAASLRRLHDSLRDPAAMTAA